MNEQRGCQAKTCGWEIPGNLECFVLATIGRRFASSRSGGIDEWRGKSSEPVRPRFVRNDGAGRQLVEAP
jgi:hypothetical protein